MCDKPCYIGMTCLWLSKLKMWIIWFDYIKNLYGSSLKYLMTDSDSFIFICETEVIYQDIVNNEAYMKKVDCGK